MLKKHSSNMKTSEANIRIIIATLILVFAIINSNIIIGLMSMFLYYTAFRRFCFTYYIFKINEKYSLTNYYVSLLPKYRPSPVFIFDENGKIIFKNNTAEVELSHIITIEDIGVKNFNDIITKNALEIVFFGHKDKFYQVEIQGISSESFLLAYVTNVTEVMELNDAIEETQREVIYAMGEIGETRSKETGNHVKRVALYSKELALLYGLSFEESDRLHMASPMHDIGKVGIPDAILNAPRKLTVEEFKIMKTHASLGYDMLKSSNKPILQAAAIVANEHHEKFDGSGYPNGTMGNDIHIYGRITAVADVFDALGSDRVYKKAWALNDIIEFFDKERGKHFDPIIVQLFQDNLDKFLIIRDKFRD